MKPSHSRRTNDTTTGHPEQVPLRALLRRVVVLSTARPASHRGIPSLPVPGRRRASGVSLSALALSLAVLSILVTPASAAPELRWIAYVRAKPGFRFGAAETVRSDGREHRTLIDRVLAIDVGPDGVVYAAREEETVGNLPPQSSLVTTYILDPKLEGGGAADTNYLGVAASSNGKLAILRQVTETQMIPPFLSDGLTVLRSTNLRVLVPPEEPPGTGGLVPTAEEDSFQLLFTNDPAGELSHAEQINVMVTGTLGTPEPIPDPQSRPVRVRDSDGQFYCGASVCFLTWQELDVTYTVGEFGANEEAVAFAESLVPIESLAGSRWREGTSEPLPTPELIVRDRSGDEQVLESVEGFCECGFWPLDWSPENDRILVLASAEGYSRLQEYRANGSEDPVDLAEGSSGPGGEEVPLDAAYGPEGIIALLGIEGGPPGTLQQLEGGEVVATEVRAFDIEGSTLAYVRAGGDVIVRDLSTGNERTVGRGAIDVSVAPDLISGSGGVMPKTPAEDERIPALVVAVIGLGALGLLGGALLLALARRRRRG
jgi:hypothetical protein